MDYGYAAALVCAGIVLGVSVSLALVACAAICVCQREEMPRTGTTSPVQRD